MEGGKVFIEPLGGVEIFQGPVEKPLWTSRKYWRGLFQDP